VQLFLLAVQQLPELANNVWLCRVISRGELHVSGAGAWHRDQHLGALASRSRRTGQYAFGGSGKLRDEVLVSRKRELVFVKKERDFLPEAATFFASGSN